MKHLLLVIFFLAAAPVYAQLTCESIFQFPGPRPHFLRESLSERLKAAQIPFTTESVITKGRDAARILGEFQNIVDDRGPLKTRLKKLNAWIQSPDHANYVVENLACFASKSTEVLQYLLNQNPHFKKAQPVRGGKGMLVTYGYDIEDPGEAIPLLFRPSTLTDAEWLALSPQLRAQQFASADAATELKPDHVGQVKKELDAAQEIRHRSFEISPDRIMANIREVASLKGNTHSIHAHVVAEFPRDYIEQPAFEAWHLQETEKNAFQALEEGLAPTHMSPMSLPKNFVNGMNQKYLTVGRRAVGQGNLADHELIDLEYRDSTRNLKTLEAKIKKATVALQERPWEGTGMSVVKLNCLADELAFSEGIIGKAITQLADEGVSDELRLVSKVQNQLFFLPLIDFEKFVLYDYKTKKQSTVQDPEVTARIAKAREKYVAGVKRTLAQAQREMNVLRNEEDRELFFAALKIDLVEWARDARISEIYPD